MLANWLVSALVWLSSHTIAQAGMLMQVSREPEVAVDYTDDVLYDTPDPTAPNGLEDKVTKVPMERIFNKLLINRTRPQPCDQQLDLFMLANASAWPQGIHVAMAGCDRPFVAHSVPHSNLLLLVVDALCPQEEPLHQHEVTLTPEEVVYNISLSCFKTSPGLWDLNRKRPRTCFNHHPKEKEVELCGRASGLDTNFVLSIALSLLVVFVGRGHTTLTLS